MDTRMSKTIRYFTVIEATNLQYFNSTYLFQFDIKHRNLKFSFYNLGYFKHKNIKLSIISFISILIITTVHYISYKYVLLPKW